MGFELHTFDWQEINISTNMLLIIVSSSSHYKKQVFLGALPL
jgi:hypothetical protein